MENKYFLNIKIKKNKFKHLKFYKNYLKNKFNIYLFSKINIIFVA